MPVSERLLDELASRCEAATDEQQHEVFTEAYELVFAPLNSFMAGADDKRRIRFLRCLGAGAFLDAAMMLVPEGSVVQIGWGDEHGPWAGIGSGTTGVMAATPALALCAAALRARAQTKED